MNFIAFQMLIGDRAKYLSLIFAIAFSSFLLQNQSSIFVALMKRTAHRILDVTDAEVWVMDPKTSYFDETKALKDTDLTRVRGVAGIDYAVPLFKSTPVARTDDGLFATCMVLGLDEATFTGAPMRLFLGQWENLKQPQSVIIDKAGYLRLFPDQPLELGRKIELNDQRVTIVGISDALPAFTSFPTIHARYQEARNFQGNQRQQLSFILVRAKNRQETFSLARRIEAETGLKASTTSEFGWACVRYYMANTGIPVNFGITVVVGILVGLVVTGQTFYLFTLENLRHFGTLKALGVTNGKLTLMVIFQALIVWFIGSSLGSALAATFFNITLQSLPTRYMNLIWQSTAGVGLLMLLIVLISSFISLRRVHQLEPAVVFK